MEVENSHKAGLPFLDRYLTLWIFIAMAIGILGGYSDRTVGRGAGNDCFGQHGVVL